MSANNEGLREALNYIINVRDDIDWLLAVLERDGLLEKWEFDSVIKHACRDLAYARDLCYPEQT